MLKQGWAISGPLARLGGRSVALGNPLDLSLARLAPGSLDRLVDRVGNALVGLPVGVLIDQRGTRAVVPHPRHDVAQARPRCPGRERVAGMPQVVKVQSRNTHDGDRLGPLNQLVEVAAPEVPAALASEHERFGCLADVAAHVLVRR